MPLNCIDPRFTTSSLDWTGARELRDRYSRFVIAGGPIGVVHPRFAAWHQAFWDNLDITLAPEGQAAPQPQPRRSSLSRASRVK